MVLCFMALNLSDAFRAEPGFDALGRGEFTVAATTPALVVDLGGRRHTLRPEGAGDEPTEALIGGVGRIAFLTRAKGVLPLGGVDKPDIGKIVDVVRAGQDFDKEHTRPLFGYTDFVGVARPGLLADNGKRRVASEEELEEGIGLCEGGEVAVLEAGQGGCVGHTQTPAMLESVISIARSVLKCSVSRFS